FDTKEHNLNWDDDTSNDSDDSEIEKNQSEFPLNDFDGDNTIDSNSSTIIPPNGIKLSTEMQKERKDWQSFLSSVLTGEVIKSEKQRISTNTRQAANNNSQIWLGIRAAT